MNRLAKPVDARRRFRFHHSSLLAMAAVLFHTPVLADAANAAGGTLYLAHADHPHGADEGTAGHEAAGHHADGHEAMGHEAAGHHAADDPSAGHVHVGPSHDHGHDHAATDVHPDGHAHDMPHPSQVDASPVRERLLLDAYADGSLPARVLALHQALGARLDAHDDTGQTLLMKAAARDDFPLVQALLAADVPMDATDIHGWSALEHAVQGHATDAALALLAAGAVERVDHHQNSTLQYAVNLVVDTRVVEALVAAGADVNRRSLDGLTVLMEALDAGNPLATIRALLAAPAIDLSVLDPYGDDALAHARERGEPAVTEAVAAAAALPR